MAVKASERVKRYQNPNGPTISTVERKVIEQDGLYFKDIDGTGTVSAVNDWRLTPAERAEAYVKVLTTSEKIGQIFTSDWRMGPKYPSPRLAANGHKPVADESGLLDEAPVNVSDSIFGSQSLPSTSDMVKKSFNRHVILRESPTPEDLADYLNQLQYLTETCDHFVPMQVMSNSRNENGEVVFGMNDATGVFATYPGTLGIAAAVKGTARIDIIDKFADTIRREWNACGLKKGYMYMADCVTDPRWQRTFGTFGEDPELIEEIFDHLIPGIQGGSNGVTPEGVSMTVKHFPGGGARENGFDPHYAAGQWNIYATPGSLQKYHIPAFRAAIRHNAESIMPYYSKPSAEKSAPQEDFNGNPIELQPYGFAYNKVFIDGLLRGQRIRRLGIGDAFVEHGSQAQLRELVGLRNRIRQEGDYAHLSALEEFNAKYVQAIEYKRKSQKYEGLPISVIILQVDGDDPYLLDKCVNDIVCVVEEQDNVDIIVAQDDKEGERFWEDRHRLSAIAKRTSGFKLNEDVVIPMDRIPDFALFLEQLNLECTAQAYRHALQEALLLLCLSAAHACASGSSEKTLGMA